MESPNEPAVQSVDEAIAFCLTKRDQGELITPRYVLETFPDFHEEVVEFLESERTFLGMMGQQTVVPGRQLAHFRLEHRIGRGSFGEVWSAWDTTLCRRVAVKTPRCGFDDDSTKQRFLREARAAGQLNHQHIIRVLEVGVFDGIPFICTELLEGETLDRWAQEQTLVSDADSKPSVESMQAARLMSQISDAVAHAHNRDVIHRDLNPKNVLVDRKGTPRILDFGVAKWSQEVSTVTVHGPVLGTPAYASPEQASGDSHELDGKSDIFSLGVMFYELLTGSRPFRGDMRLLLHKIQFEAAKPPSEANRLVPNELSRICLKCLEKAPEDRYATADELRDDIDRFLASKPSVTELASRGGEVAPASSSRTRKIVTTCAFIGLLALSSFAIVRSRPQIAHMATQAIQPASATDKDATDKDATDKDATDKDATGRNDDPQKTATTKANRLSTLDNKTFRIDQIEDLAERTLVAFEEHAEAVEIAETPRSRRLRNQFQMFERNTNRLNSFFERNDDWRLVAGEVKALADGLSKELQAGELGPVAEMHWDILNKHLNALVVLAKQKDD